MGRAEVAEYLRGEEVEILCVNHPSCPYPPDTYMNSEALSELNVHP